MSKKDLFYDQQLPQLREEIIKAIKNIGIDKTLEDDAFELAYICTDGLFEYAGHVLEDEEE